MIETLKKRDKGEDLYLKAYREGGYKDTVNNFIQFMIKYVDIEFLNKKYEENDEILSRNFLFYTQSEELNYLKYIFKEIKRFIPLIFKLSQDFWLVDKLEKSNLTDDSIIKMIENFVSLERTGRKRLFNKYDQQAFQEIKEKYQKILDLYEETKKWDGETKGSILDYAKALKDHNISKKVLLQSMDDFDFWDRHTSKWSKRSKYRFDKDIFKINDLKHFADDIFGNYDFFMSCLEEHEKYIKSKN